MRPVGPRALILLASLATGVLVGASCGPKRLDRGRPAGGPQVGVYRGRVADEAGRARRFRLLLFAQLPDRLHAEVVSPLGTTELIIDGTDVRMSVTIPKQRLAFVGTPAPDVLLKLVGVRISTAGLVEALLRGEQGNGDYRVRRRGGAVPGLPGEFAISGGGRTLELRLKRRGPLRAAAEELGTASVPGGFDVNPLEELDWEWLEEGAATPNG